MKNWDETIKFRRTKEAATLATFDLKISTSQYQDAVIDAVAELSSLERRAVLLRLSKSLPIARVADQMGMSWDGADELIDRALGHIYAHLKQYQFNYSVNKNGVFNEVHQAAI